MKQSPVIIIGVNLEAQIAAEILQAQGFFIYGFLYVETPPTDREINEIPVLGSVSDREYEKVLKGSEVDYFIAENNSKMRDSLMKKIFELTNKLSINVVHPSVMVANSAQLASGNFIFPTAVIGTEAQIESMNIIGTGAKIEAHSIVGKFNYIGTGVIIGSKVKIENHCTIGAGAILFPNITIHSGAVIAPGAIVNENVPEGMTVLR